MANFDVWYKAFLRLLKCSHSGLFLRACDCEIIVLFIKLCLYYTPLTAFLCMGNEADILVLCDWSLCSAADVLIKQLLHIPRCISNSLFIFLIFLSDSIWLFWWSKGRPSAVDLFSSCPTLALPSPAASSHFTGVSNEQAESTRVI